MPIGAGQLDKIVGFAKENHVEFVVIGPEDPLAGGLVDLLNKAGIRAFGPNQVAAQLEADKWFAKELMRHQAVPTAEALIVTGNAPVVTLAGTVTVAGTVAMDVLLLASETVAPPAGAPFSCMT